MKTYSVLQCLPDDGQRCLCFGHHTYCCVEDMDEEAAWHEVTFKFEVSSYLLKKELPTDPEESVLQEITIEEYWESGPEFTDGHVIGVTEWRPIGC